MANTLKKNEIFYDRENNTLKIYDGVSTISNLKILGIIDISDPDTILQKNEIGYDGNSLRIGDGITTFNNLVSFNHINVINNIDNNSSSSDALSAAKGYELLTSINSINNTKTSKSNYGLVKVGNNIDVSNDGIISISNDNVMSALNKGADTTKYLDNTGNWTIPPDTQFTLENATANKLGGVKIGNNININNGTISVNDSNTSQKGVVQLSDSLTSTSTSTAATSNSVKVAYDTANKLFTGATESKAGSKGIVPAPGIGDQDKYLKGDGNWAGNATQTESGLMSSSDKSKLDNIAENANNFTLQKATSNTLGGVKIGSNITSDSETGTISINNSNVLAALNKGTDTAKYLNNAGNWTVPPDTTYNEATTSTAGLMSASDKSKLDNIANNATNVTVDSTISDSSTNAIQNKVIKSYVDTKISDLVGSAPETLDTLQELATALGEDKNFSTTMTTELGKKVDKVTGKQLSTNDFTNALKTKLDNITDSADSVSITRDLTSGTKIGTITINGVSTDLYSTNNTEYDLVTDESDGLMSSSDKSKLDNIAENANNYSHPTYTARTGKPTVNQSVVLGNTITISQITSDSLGHVTNATDRTITFTHPAYTATTGIESTNQTPSFGETFNISQIISDSTGHISSQTTRTVKIPNTTVTASTNGTGGSNGLMLATDKEKLDTVAENANNYSHPTQTALTGKPTANQTPSFGESFTISQVSVNTLGHVTSLTDKTVTIPNTAATSDTLGLVKIGSNIDVSSGVISVNTGSTSQAGVLQLTDSYSSTSTTTAATANSVKSAYDSLNSSKVNISDIVDNLTSSTTTNKPLSAKQGYVLNTRITDTGTSVNSTISSLQDTVTSNYDTLNTKIDNTLANVSASNNETIQLHTTSISSLTSRVTTNESDISTLTTRVDNIVTNSSTESTEVVDARLDSESTTHSNLGTCIRYIHTEEMSDCKDINKLLADISSCMLATRKILNAVDGDSVVKYTDYDIFLDSNSVMLTTMAQALRQFIDKTEKRLSALESA